MTPPPPDVLEKQLLERLITERVLMQFAKDTGMRVDDVQVERTIQRIAQDNKLSPDEFRKAVEREGIPYAKYREDIRNEITVQRLREREVDSRDLVSDAEVDNFLATHRRAGRRRCRVPALARPGARARAGLARPDRRQAPARARRR